LFSITHIEKNHMGLECHEGEKMTEITFMSEHVMSRSKLTIS